MVARAAKKAIRAKAVNRVATEETSAAFTFPDDVISFSGVSADASLAEPSLQEEYFAEAPDLA